MVIRIIPEGMSDTAHAVFEAQEIRNVFLELPDKPFQAILDKYQTGKMSVEQMKSELFKAMGAEEREVDHELAKKHLAGEIAHEELEAIEIEAREIHVLEAAKEVGAKLVAMDLPLDELEQWTEKEIEKEHLDNVKAVFQAKTLPIFMWKISEILHFPMYMVERLMRHPSLVTTNPFKHNVKNCNVCKISTRWDRYTHHLVVPILNLMPLSKELKDQMKIAYLIQEADKHREKHMAMKITEVYKELKEKLGREPNVLVIVHLWNSFELERMIKGLE